MRDMLLVIGAGGHGKVLADVAAKMNCWREIAFLDDHSTENSCLGFPILGTTELINDFKQKSDIIVGIGNNSRRKVIQEELSSKDFSIATLIHPSSTVGLDVTIGEGSVIMAGVVINPSSRIGCGCIINTSATVDHDCCISDYAHLSPAVHLAGSVTIGEATWLGTGAIVINDIVICESCIIGAGAVVVKNITEKGKYIGVPAKRIT